MNDQSTNAAQSFNLREIIAVYTRQWKWFLLSCIVCLGAAFVYLRYATPLYGAYAKIMLVDDKNASTPASALLKDFELISEAESKRVEDEIEVMKSRKIMANVVERLKLNVQYFSEGRIHDMEIFPDPPIKVNFIASDSTIKNSKFGFNVKILSETSFEYRVAEEEKSKKYYFGENIPTEIGDVVITPKVTNIENYANQTIKVAVQPVKKVAESFKNKILITPVEKLSKVINISLQDANKEKARQIINTLIDEYNTNSIEQKNAESKATADFINERIDLIATDLANVDSNAERFKTGNRLTDITSEADIYLSSGSENEQELIQSRTELSMVNYMNSYLKNQDDFEPIPSNIGLSDPSISNTSAKYNQLILERERLLKSSNEKNPIIVNLDQQLAGLRQSMQQSLSNHKSTLSIRVNNLEQQAARINSRISSVPGQERQLRDIQRQQQIKESLYLYLLEKREEATISLTATSPNAKIIDSAYSPNDAPISPKRKMVFIAALMAGMAFPFSIIYLRQLLDNKIHNKEDLSKLFKDMPILGEIPKVKGKNHPLVIHRNDRSILSESFRIIRTNLDYLIRSRKGQNTKSNNVIYVTSTINGEGKTFVSINMALTLANSDKTVLLIGADIRNPKLHQYLKKQMTGPGLTDYLYDRSVNRQQVTETIEVHGNRIDLIQSGKTPPNPAELLMNERIKTLLDEASEVYDFIIVDTAPCMLVTDTLLFSQYADHTIYVTRADYTNVRLLNFPYELFADKKLKGMMMVVNDVKESDFGYGGKYGYGYYGNKRNQKKAGVQAGSKSKAKKAKVKV
ncbi:polysaccharide biosynthesis tyrosine autokinase [Ascidiimonas aurantiaca]|uniref:GumC family protein n=1 Tax=Ascidiimonas aurantiaca TaxID=1685432 RepID=UPI0030ED830B